MMLRVECPAGRSRKPKNMLLVPRSVNRTNPPSYMLETNNDAEYAQDC